MAGRVRVVFLLLCVAGCSGEPPPPAMWTAAELAALRSLTLERLGPPLPSPGNAVADDPRAVALGRALFADPRLSGSGTLSCASCHQPDRHFTDGLPTGVGMAATARNTPALAGGAWQHWFYWDGRRDSLWAQALTPIEAAEEMAGTRLAVARLLGTDPDYRRAYVALFGPFPAAPLAGALPAHAGPFGDGGARTAWAALTPPQRHAINRVFANAGKAIAAFERTLMPRETAFDRYVAALTDEGEAAAARHLSEAALAGARLFVDVEKTRCLQCHNGPLLTNGAFHNVGTGVSGGARPDHGRLLGVQAVLRDEFNCLGPYSDAEPDECSALRFLHRGGHGDQAGAFKTPSLRNVANTAPYMHDGRFADLSAVLAHYNAPSAAGEHELQPLDLTTQELAQLEAFLHSLSEPAAVATARDDGRWSASERALLASLALDELPPPPPDPGNGVFDNADAAALGGQLFFDTALSGSGELACASCHDAARGLADGRARAIGVQTLARNAPGLRGVAHRRWYYWDGRKDSLWSQALEPIEAPAEMGGDRLAAVRHVLSEPALRAAYEKVFGTAPAFDWATLPRHASPLGDRAAREAWAGLSAATRDALDRSFARLGKAIAAYERGFALAPTRFDRYVAAVLADDAPRAATLMSGEEIAGLRLFLSGQTMCVSCHNGPRFSDGAFHNIGTGEPDGEGGDPGRAAGIERLAADAFNCASRYADDWPDADCAHLDTLGRAEMVRLLRGAFRTPGLRELAHTAPYMHDGRFATLEEVIRHYVAPPDKRVVEHELSPLSNVTDRDVAALTAFLKTLSAPAAD